MLIFLLGTGQRNAFVFFGIIFLLYWLITPKKERYLPSRTMIILIAVGTMAMIILTIANGRVSSDTENNIVGALTSIIDRFINVNQKTALSAFEYIQTQPTVWGYDWAMMLRDILPGKSGYLSVDRIVYYLAYGTYSGTGPPCLWGSAWYNYSWFGVIVFPFIMGIVYQSIYKSFHYRLQHPLRRLIYVALCVYLGIWTYGTPMTLFNNGVVTILILYLLLFKLKVKINSVRL